MPVIVPSVLPTFPVPTAKGPIVGIEYNGFETGVDSDWHLQEITGWDDMPDLVVADSENPSGDGVFFGVDRQGKRVVQLTLVTYGDPALSKPLQRDQHSVSVDRLVRAFQPLVDEELPFTIRYQNTDGEVSEETLMCRPRKRVVPRKTQDVQLTTVATVQLEASDPSKYGPEQSATTGLALGAAGRSYPRHYPWSYGAGGSGGMIQALNIGSRDSFPVATISGPVPSPTIEHVDLGMHVKVGLDLAAEDLLVVDFQAQTITLFGVSRYYAITGDSDWFALRPGMNNIRYTAAAFLPDTRLTLRWRSAD